MWSPRGPAHVGGQELAYLAEAGTASTKHRPSLTRGRLREPFAGSPWPFGLEHLFSEATQQLCRARGAWVTAACTSFLSLYGTSLPCRCPACRTLSVHDDDPLKSSSHQRGYSPPNHNLVSICFVSVNCWDETLRPSVW